MIANYSVKMQGVPSYNCSITDQSELRVSKIGYMPMVSSSPTELGTVHQVQKTSQAVASAVDQQEIVIVMDQAVYSKALQIMWQQPSEFSNVIPRMGAFHITCTLLAVIGKRFGEAGLQDLLVESGVVAGGSVASVIAGRQYNRAMRAHKTVFEAFMRLLWGEFERAELNTSRVEAEVAIANIRSLITKLRDSPSNDIA